MRLLIDPGHGMSNKRKGVYDPGAVSGGVSEADVALTWAFTVKHVLSQEGIQCFMTRISPETSAPLSSRLAIARRNQCTHVLSIHCNALGNMLVSGTETFYSDPLDISWANDVNDSCVLAMGRKDRGVKPESASQHDRLAILQTGLPACLLEIGFITNPKDRERMLKRDVRLAFATELARRINL